MTTLREIPPQEAQPDDADLLLVETAAGTRTTTRGDLLKNARTTATIISDTISNGETDMVTFATPKSIEILAVTSSGPARIRLYSTIQAQFNDAIRAVTTRPTAGAGIILETVHETAGTINLDPHAHGSNMENPPAPELYATITNTGTTAALTVTLTYLEREHP